MKSELGLPLLGHQPVAFDDGHLFITPGDLFPEIAWTNLPFLEHAEIEAAATARMEPLHRIGLAESDAEFETRHARLGHHDQGAADPELIADAHRPFVHPLDGEVLAEPSRVKRQVGIFFPPERVMLRRIDVHRFFSPAVYRQVRLFVAFEIEELQRETALNRLFVDPGRDNFAMPSDSAGTSDLHGEKFHGSLL